jgi:hypothetical protein
MTRISAQQKIVRQAPRLRAYYNSEGISSVIPDTAKAREWAIKQKGAHRFGSLAFHRIDPDGRYCDYRVGDFHCVISRENTCIDDGVDYETDPFASAVTIALNAERLLSLAFRVNEIDVKCTFLSSSTIGLSIPSSAFEVEVGEDFLEELYREAVFTLSAYAPGYALKVSYEHHFTIENSRLQSGLVAIPFTFDEIPRLRQSPAEFVTRPRTAPSVKYEWKIDQEILAEMKHEARIFAGKLRKAIARDRLKSKRSRFWSPSKEYCLSNEEYAQCGAPSTRTKAQENARRLIERITRDDLTEFSQRDVLRGLHGRKHGAAGEGGGIAEALQILLNTGHIHKCPQLKTDYACKPPSPWFVVNPLLFTTSGTSSECGSAASIIKPRRKGGTI